jgi:alkanesulfonate monooxygenase SsuD/methylene tetrahydromethanopterin reductase-like flavin-dependent oxidoreductase (luciferase family)
MDVGVYFDLRNPPRWRRPWPERYGRALDRAVEAERLGAGAVWLSEHHLFEDGYLPQPMTFAAAVATRTSRVRIGTALMLAPLRPPLDLAEQFAIVDILSSGRVEMGLGLGYRIPEFEAYGRNIKDRFALLESGVRAIRTLWQEKTCTPPPVQDPVPGWIGATGPRAARLAGRLGEGLLWLDPALLEPYVRGLTEAGHARADARMAGLANLILADDPEAAWPRIAPHLAYQRDTYNRYGAEGRADAALRPATLDPSGAPVNVDELRQPAAEAIPPSFDVVTPEEAIERLTRWLDPLPVRHVYLWESIAGMPDDLADRHVELLATRLAPALAHVGTPLATKESP